MSKNGQSGPLSDGNIGYLLKYDNIEKVKLSDLKLKENEKYIYP